MLWRRITTIMYYKNRIILYLKSLLEKQLYCKLNLINVKKYNILTLILLKESLYEII